jgi:hypothetical protein
MSHHSKRKGIEIPKIHFTWECRVRHFGEHCVHFFQYYGKPHQQTKRFPIR